MASNKRRATGLAGVAAMSSKAARGARLFRAVEAQREACGEVVCAADWVDYERCITAARTHLDRAMYNRLWEEGRRLSLQQTIAYALGTGDPHLD